MKKLFDLFDEIGLPYFRQGSLSDADYPTDFFTFWNIDTPNESFYDNRATRYIEYIQVGFYTNDAKKIYSVLDDFIEKAEQKGFILAGRAKDANADKDDYFGRVCYIRIINNI
jgi:hypothetical protein